jgi:eukaryotic-like serine/threonine-protein kinase
MPLLSGTRLGPYEILAPIGSGGMGEVYRARDTRLGREVAIKVSNDQFSERFEREARAVAALNHPNICQLYDVGPNYLVMELVDGPTLADRIARGPIPLQEALALTEQLANALEAAHEKGIVHRDLKPANIKLTPDGKLKVLDFGLAKTAEPTGSPESSPTLSLGQTQAGTLLGTAAYMSPEQARGLPADKRADIWAFGCVLYEMLTARRVFPGQTISDTLASVLKEEPDLSRVPAKMQRVLHSCLQKDPKQRLQAIGDWRLLITDDAPSVGTRRASHAPWIVATAVFAAAALLFGIVSFRHLREVQQVVKSSLLPPENSAYALGNVPAVSPDGRHVAFTLSVGGKAQLWIRDLDSLAARPLPGSDGASMPFWSPDSRFVAFFTPAKLIKIDVTGGPALALCDVQQARGGTWNQNNLILFAPSTTGGLYQISSGGGKPAPVTTPDASLEQTSDRLPWFLPDGQHFLFTAISPNADKDVIYLGDLRSGKRQTILAAASSAVYSPPGYLLFLRDRNLMAQPFNARDGKISDEAVPVAEQVDFSEGTATGQFSASTNGVLVYTSGAPTSDRRQFVWLDRSGNTAGTLGAPARLRNFSISPDGRTVAVSQFDVQTDKQDIWLYDVANGAGARFTLDDRQNDGPVWSRDGAYIAFRSWAAGITNISQKTTKSGGPQEILDDASGDKAAGGWSPDGQYLIEIRVRDSNAKDSIWLVPRKQVGKPFLYLAAHSFNLNRPSLSPNGLWLAYTSDETKQRDIYVSSFPTPKESWKISTNGGDVPAWSRDGKELYFVDADRQMMAVEIKSGPNFVAAPPKALFKMPQGASLRFDVASDGRFLVHIPAVGSTPVPITVVQNWTAGLRK